MYTQAYDELEPVTEQVPREIAEQQGLTVFEDFTPELALTVYQDYAQCEHGVTGPCALCSGPCPSCGAADGDQYCAHDPVRVLDDRHDDTCHYCWARVRPERDEPRDPRENPYADYDQMAKDAASERNQ